MLLDKSDYLFFVFGCASVANCGTQRQVWRNGVFGIQQKYFFVLDLLHPQQVHSPLVVVFWLVGRDVDDLHFLVYQPARTSDGDGSLPLVSSQDEESHPRKSHSFNSALDFILQFVFDRSRPNQLQIPLYLLIALIYLDLLLLSDDASSLLQFLIETTELLFRYRPSSQHESS